jgi:hypothetical protein
MNIFNAYNVLLLYNYNTVSGEAIAIATGHAMHVFNDLHIQGVPKNPKILKSPIIVRI